MPASKLAVPEDVVILTVVQVPDNETEPPPWVVELVSLFIKTIPVQVFVEASNKVRINNPEFVSDVVKDRVTKPAVLAVVATVVAFEVSEAVDEYPVVTIPPEVPS